MSARRTIILAAAGLASIFGMHVNQAVAAYGDPIPAIVRSTMYHGWPHYPTEAEVDAVPRYVLNSVAPRNYGAQVSCQWVRPSVSPVVCGVVLRKGYGKGPKHARFRVVFRAWEDGSWRLYGRMPFVPR